MVELIALYLAGLSFFFTGVEGISDNLRQLSGRRFRRMLVRATHNPVAAGLLGVGLGAITQSTSVVAFILSGMAASGLLPMSRALVVLAWSNVGTALLVFIAAMDLHLPILFLIGASGLILAFKLFNRWKPGFAGLLSIGLVFFGLDMAKQAFKPLTSSPGFTDAAKLFDLWPDAAFFLGIAMRTVVHSSSAAAAVTITINKGGMLGEFPAMMSIAGLGLGTALATYLLSSNLRGVPRQIAVFQSAGNIVACLLAAGLLLFERWSGEPLLMAMTHRLSATTSGRMAYMYLVLNLMIVFASLASLRWAPKWLAWWCPPTPDQDLSRPMYLQTEALNSPETALDLVALEQQRLVRAVSHFLEAARGDKAIRLKLLHVAAGQLGGEITHFLESLMSLPIGVDLTSQVIAFQRKEETLRALEENVFLFAEVLQNQGNLPEMAGRLVEALDTLVLTAMDALGTKDITDITLLVQLTEDRGGMMERLRGRLQLDAGQTAASIATLHYATTLFERNVWLLRQLALWLREDARLSAA
jgi:phosphate:Na+ symporter